MWLFLSFPKKKEKEKGDDVFVCFWLCISFPKKKEKEKGASPVSSEDKESDSKDVEVLLGEDDNLWVEFR